MSPLTNFCKSAFEWRPLEMYGDLKWLDGSAYLPLSDGRVAAVDLDGEPQNNHYDRFVVRILDTKNGEIDRKVFKFDAFLDTKARSDKRTADHPIPGNKTYYAWRSRNGDEPFKWYIAVPKDTAPIVMALQTYVKLFF